MGLIQCNSTINNRLYDQLIHGERKKETRRQTTPRGIMWDPPSLNRLSDRKQGIACNSTLTKVKFHPGNVCQQRTHETWIRFSWVLILKSASPKLMAAAPKIATGSQLRKMIRGYTRGLKTPCGHGHTTRQLTDKFKHREFSPDKALVTTDLTDTWIWVPWFGCQHSSQSLIVS